MCGVFTFSDRLNISHHIKIEQYAFMTGNSDEVSVAGRRKLESWRRPSPGGGPQGPPGATWCDTLHCPGRHTRCVESSLSSSTGMLSALHIVCYLQVQVLGPLANLHRHGRPSCCRNVRAASAACRHACATLHRLSQLNNDPNIC